MFKLPENPYHSPGGKPDSDYWMRYGYDVGRKDTLKAVVKWLFGECTEHPIDKGFDGKDIFHIRRFCPQCMEELE